MADFHLLFCDPETKANTVEIPFTLTGTDISWRWLDHLHKAIYVDRMEADNNRWSGWETNCDTHEKICERMNSHLAILTSYYPDVFGGVKATPNMSQDDFNKMHTLFEVYRGELYKPHPYFENGTEEFRKCIELLNIDIHLFELKSHSPKTKSANFNFPTANFTPLTDDDKKLFVVDKTPNTIYLEFNMRGKTLFDLFNDDDDHVGDENVRRYKWLGPDFRLIINGWSPEFKAKRLAEIDEWWHRKQNFLNGLGYYKDDPLNTMGWLPLATADDDDIESLIEPRQWLKGAKFW